MEIADCFQEVARVEYLGHKNEDSLNKNEKLVPIETLFQNSRVGEIPKQTDQNTVISKEKQKIKQFLPIRSETIHLADVKTPLLKRHMELTTPMTSKVPILPLLSIRTSALEELYKELKDLKANVIDLEEKNKVNSQCIELGKLKINHLEDHLSRLKSKISSSSSSEKKEDLENKLKDLQASWKKSVSALSQQIQDLEQEAKSLMGRTESMRGLLCKNSLKHNYLRKRININGSNSENDYNSSEILNSSSRFRLLIQTPSLTSLFH